MEQPPAVVPAQFASPLRLTPEQDADFLRECIDRIYELQREMGLSVTNDVEPNSWMWLRKCHESYYQGDLSWRLAFGGIFTKSNLTLGSGMRHVRYNAARVQDDLLGTSPFLAALAQKQDKEEFAKQVEAEIQRKISVSNVQAAIRQAQKIAIYRNECVVKTGYISDTTPFIGEATVLVDAATGEPIKTPDKGLYVFENDQLIPSPDVQGMMLLEEDPTFQMAQNPTPGLVTIPAYGNQPERTGRYQYFSALPQVMVHQQGVYCKALDYRSFLCPLKVESIHDADTVVHLYMETPNRLQKIYGGIDCSQQYFAWWNQPGQNKPKYEQGENDLPTTQIFQQIIVAEVYRRCDPDKTGEDKEVLGVMDWTNQKWIYRNYLANHMEKRPFESIPGIEQVPGRWYGRGIYGMLDAHLFYEDVELSRSFYKNSQDSTIQFAYRDAVEGWANGIAPVIGDGRTYWVRSDWDTEGRRKPIWRENMASNFEADQKMMETMRQSADSLVGAISTATASESDFNQSKTATGNQLVQQASDVITKATEQEQITAVNAILSQVVDVILEHMDTKVLAVDPETKLVATINRHEARNLSRDVRLLLTRSKSTQLLNTSAQALQIADKYNELADSNPRRAKLIRPLVINQLKGLEVDDADSYCREITDAEVQQWAQAQQQKQPAPVAHSIAAKLEDFTPQERPQAVQQFGIQPSSPEEAEAAAAAGDAATAAGKPAPQLPGLPHGQPIRALPPAS
jgi:hypothetical protein